MRPTPLPTTVLDGAFRVREALAAGASSARLRARDLDGSVWGVRRRGAAATLLQRCELIARRLRDDAFFSHSTAAMLLGAPLPLGVERAPAVHVAVIAPHPAPHARGIHGHSLGVDRRDLVTTKGLRHTSAARTWCDLSGMLGLGDLVAVGDYLIHHELPFVSRRQLAESVGRWGSRRGASRLRAALPLLDDRAESRPESQLRVIIVTGGLPPPRVNHQLVETETGAALRPDLEFTDYRVLVEYQGEYHRTRRQWRKDMTRRSRLEADGWYVMELNADDLRDPAELVARIAKVLRGRGWRG